MVLPLPPDTTIRHAMVYFSPGSRVLDRSFIEIGDRVVFGVNARLHAHVIDRDENGTGKLLLGVIRIGSDSMIGGFSLLTSGVEVDANQVTPAIYAMPPFSRWQGGRRLPPHQWH